MSPPSTLSIEQLLEQRQWLGRLCSRLVRDASAADDLAQEAMIRALGAPSAAEADSHGRLRNWLAATVRNVARETGRRAGRRREREELVARPEAERLSPAEAMASAELREQLARLVLTLPDSEREAVVLRYYEGLTPQEIADQLGDLSVGAVRQRIYRGMERLRGALDAEDRNGRAAWLPAAVLIARQGSLAPPAPASAPAGLLPGVAVGWTVLGALVALLVGRWLWGMSPDPEPALVPVIAALEPPAAPDEIEDVQPREDRIEVAEATTARVAGAGRSFRLLDPRSRRPLVGAEWYLRMTGPLDPEPLVIIDGDYLPPAPVLASGQTDASGVIELPPVQVEVLQLVVERTATSAVASFAIDGIHGPTRRVDLVPPTGRTVTGRLVDHSGRAISGAEIMEFTVREKERIVGRTGPDGRFILLGMGRLPRQLMKRADGAIVSTWSDGSHFYARAEPSEPWVAIDGLLPSQRKGSVATGEEDLGDVKVRRPTTLKGFVVDRKGRPVPGVLVDNHSLRSRRLAAAARGDHTVDYAWSPTGGRKPAVTDASGAFALPILGVGSRAKKLVQLIAQAPDGRAGELKYIKAKEGELPYAAVIELGSRDVIRLHFQDRARRGEPLETASGLSNLVAWRLRPIRPSASDGPQDARFAALLGGEVAVLPSTGLRRLRSSRWLDVEVPGYEPVAVEVTNGVTDIDVLLDRRERARVKLGFEGPHAIAGATATVVLMGQRPMAAFDFPNPNRFSATHGEGAYAGGVTHDVLDGDEVELAWPWDSPGWIVVFPDSVGAYTKAPPIVIGPLSRPVNGTEIEAEFGEWTIYDRVGDLKLDGKPEHPLY